MVADKAQQGKVSLQLAHAGIPETIIADERKLKQILYNLFANAVKFTPEGGAVRVTAHGVDRGPGKVAKEVEIRIADSGIGLARDDLERIFEVFVQVEQPADCSCQGTGLGLPLTRRLVELHGGRLWAESDGAGQGSTFVCHLPVIARGT